MEKLQKELQAKKDAEEKAKADEAAWIAAEAACIAARIEVELSKGDAEKFKDLINDLEELKTKYIFKSKKFKNTQQLINNYITKAIEISK